MSDPLDDVLNLEDTFYTRGYQQGLHDGVQAGRIEGRSFGMQKGFEKFLEAGRLSSKAIVWANRLPTENRECKLPALPQNARLSKNVSGLYALVEPDTLSTENSDEAVQDFDDRVKRAQGKAKVVERMVAAGTGSVKDVPREG